jgi:hypothetical protein
MSKNILSRALQHLDFDGPDAGGVDRPEGCDQPPRHSSNHSLKEGALSTVSSAGDREH